MWICLLNATESAWERPPECPTTNKRKAIGSLTFSHTQNKHRKPDTGSLCAQTDSFPSARGLLRQRFWGVGLRVVCLAVRQSTLNSTVKCIKRQSRSIWGEIVQAVTWHFTLFPICNHPCFSLNVYSIFPVRILTYFRYGKCTVALQAESDCLPWRQWYAVWLCSETSTTLSHVELERGLVLCSISFYPVERVSYIKLLFAKSL